MGAISTHQPQTANSLTIALRIGVVALTLATAQIHLTLGGLLFTLNAIGYATLAAAMVLPGPVGRIRWLTRYALIGFTAVTIAGWLAFGARFDLAYIDKAIETALIGLLLIESWVIDGGPLAVARRARGDVAALLS
ncbi:MAG TPA: hypothetical protein VGQ89_13525 [Candidatus Limnocylindrales bacterium]|nr:hypothetical protein [Candidatus Limnocylindrales bacterium]